MEEMARRQVNQAGCASACRGIRAVPWARERICLADRRTIVLRCAFVSGQVWLAPAGRTGIYCSRLPHATFSSTSPHFAWYPCAGWLLALHLSAAVLALAKAMDSRRIVWTSRPGIGFQAADLGLYLLALAR